MMHPTYALQGLRTGEHLSHGGRVIVHHSKAELAFLFPRTKVVKLQEKPGRIIRLADVPDLVDVHFPPRKETSAHA